MRYRSERHRALAKIGLSGVKTRRVLFAMFAGILGRFLGETIKAPASQENQRTLRIVHCEHLKSG